MKNTTVWMAIPVGTETGSACLTSEATEMLVLEIEASCTQANDGSLVACQAHPADDAGLRRTDGLLAVVNAVNVSFVETLQV